MGVLSNLVRGLVRGADRMAATTSKRGPKSYNNKARGVQKAGFLTSSGKFIKVREMIPEFVVPDLTGFKLKPYVSYKAPPGSEEPMTAKRLFTETVAGQIEKDIKDGNFDPENLQKYGFEPSQKEKLVQLYPKNYVQ
ncbi:39S ribosomal protein L41, mitochondrial [Spea bombifrons]|uniref:39S ribosomal protein L41, mitochondrial n=1 Tax=Spea bombifrons TaxID=233779 RepID=UPI00234B7C71|nr:39S ribosomal protein L41, mitochondrial [Spea bombifrons]